MSRVIDLRSDTVTRPTLAMLDAMRVAELGDDGYGEDRTVNCLESLAANLLGKEAAVFVASGTMGNLVSLLAHCQRGDEVFTEAESHIFCSESGAMAALGGIFPLPLPGRHGILDPDTVAAAIATGAQSPRARLLCVENTHNRGGGTVTDGKSTAALCAVARCHDLKVHVDGARLFNAAVALGVPARDLVAEADSVSFCLAKGLCCPVGAVVCGDRTFVAEARRWRKALGGGMRQAGVLAAAGIVALETMVERLACDHLLARQLAAGLAALPGVAVNLATVQTNIVMADVSGLRVDATGFARAASATGVLCSVRPPHRIRFVTSMAVDQEGIETALRRLGRVVSGMCP